MIDGLSLRKTRVGDEGSAALTKLTRLIRLDLDDTRITDATLAHLAGMPRLQTLSLTGTEITDRGLLAATAPFSSLFPGCHRDAEADVVTSSPVT